MGDYENLSVKHRRAESERASLIDVIMESSKDVGQGLGGSVVHINIGVNEDGGSSRLLSNGNKQ